MLCMNHFLCCLRYTSTQMFFSVTGVFIWFGSWLWIPTYCLAAKVESCTKGLLMWKPYVCLLLVLVEIKSETLIHYWLVLVEVKSHCTQKHIANSVTSLLLSNFSEAVGAFVPYSRHFEGSCFFLPWWFRDTRPCVREGGKGKRETITIAHYELLTQYQFILTDNNAELLSQHKTPSPPPEEVICKGKKREK